MTTEPTSAKVNRPPSTDFYQQRLKSWQPILTPLTVILLFAAIGIAFIPTGVSLLSTSDSIYQSVVTYDGDGASPDCTIHKQFANKICNVTFTIHKDVTGPLYVYYSLGNFYQNHRRYVSSYDSYQLLGQKESKSTLDGTCIEKVTNGSLLLNPCGLIANSYFTDQIYLFNSSTKSVLDESSITWSSDKDLFKQPDGFQYVDITATPSMQCADVNLPSSCKSYYDESTGKLYLFYYPDDATTQYLYETYPGIVSPIDGVTDPHFQVWMRTAALPNFRKLYGKISGNFKTGDTLNFVVVANYEVSSFDGSKSLVISTLSEFGGKNPNLGIAYIVVGIIALIFALLFAAKQYLAPRPFADESLLQWKTN